MRRFTAEQVLWVIGGVFAVKALVFIVALAFVSPVRSAGNVLLMVTFLSISVAAVCSVGILIQRWIMPISAAFQMGYREALRQQVQRGEHLSMIRGKDAG